MKREHVFERLDPPPGGLAKLEARLGHKSHFELRARRLVPIAGALALAAAVLLVARRRPIDLVAEAAARGDVPLFELGLAPPPTAHAALMPDQRETAALTEVPTSNGNVSFYWVSSTSWGE